MQLRCMVFLHVPSFPQNCHNVCIHIGPKFEAVIVGLLHSFCQNKVFGMGLLLTINYNS